jgi:TolA-binding protein
MDAQEKKTHVFSSSLLLLGLFALAVGCQSTQKRNSHSTPTETQQTQTQESSTTAEIQSLKEKVAQLETQLLVAQEKIKSTEASVSQWKPPSASREVLPTVTLQAGKPVEAPAVVGDLDQDWTIDRGVQAFRQGKRFYETNRFTESILAWNAFLETSPEHTLASHAQYSMGLAYLAMSEPDLALMEFQKLLTSYPGSPLVSESLYQLAALYLRQGKSEPSKRALQILRDQFPLSPAAKREAPQAKPVSSSIMHSGVESVGVTGIDAPPGSEIPPDTIPETSPEKLEAQ